VPEPKPRTDDRRSDEQVRPEATEKRQPHAMLRPE
jgi:hypothetical protein